MQGVLYGHIKKYIGKLLTELENHVLKGAAGPKEKGDKGDQGEVEDQGPKGKEGERGEKGDKGDSGEAGKDGRDGERGERGATGLQGEKGDKGERGEKGNEGVGLHLKEWKLGKKYKKGDYVFITVVQPKTKEKYDVMFICSHPIEAAKLPKMIKALGSLKHHEANVARRAQKARQEIGAMWAPKVKKEILATVEHRAKKAIEVKEARKAPVAKKGKLVHKETREIAGNGAKWVQMEKLVSKGL